VSALFGSVYGLARAFYSPRNLILRLFHTPSCKPQCFGVPFDFLRSLFHAAIVTGLVTKVNTDVTKMFT
jgi:hypothetical protein